MNPTSPNDLSYIVQNARRQYVARLAGATSTPWWTAVIITASSKRQAEKYQRELQRRIAGGKIPGGIPYLVTPDLNDQRLGSGGATLHALGQLAGSPATERWWRDERVLLIHSGGDSRRLPQYSLSGKLFSAVPVTTPWGEASTVFDEMLVLSTLWVEHLASGLLVASGDVVLVFDAAALDWNRAGVSGVAMRQAAEVGMRHGVYVTDGHGRVYKFLQKPTLAELSAAGGLLENNEVALDTGLLRFSPEAAARLTALASLPAQSIARDGKPVGIDLYTHITLALTGQWKPSPGDAPELHELARSLKGLEFSCSLVPGEFTHIGTTHLFRQLMTGETDFSRFQAAVRRFSGTRAPGVSSSGVVIDSVLEGGADLGAGTVVIECHLTGRLRAASGAVLHGLDQIPGPIEVPEDTVVHQLPVSMPGTRPGVVIRVYGVGDDPKAATESATWFSRPILEVLREFGLDAESVWPGVPEAERSLWNASLFPLSTPDDAWQCAAWLMRLPSNYTAQRWTQAPRFSFASSAEWADAAALEAARLRRSNANWRMLAVSLVESGADLRPLLANSPGTQPLTEAGQRLCDRSRELETNSPTEAASRSYAAGLFFAQAGLAREAEESHEAAFHLVQHAVEMGAGETVPQDTSVWKHHEVIVEAPARIDLGGGWSDTPPFCLDWGGTVLNVAVTLGDVYPIRTTLKRLSEPVIRCISDEDRASVEYRTAEELLRPSAPGDPFAIPRMALRLAGWPGFKSGGIEIRTSVNLPMGSGLGTSSILAVTVLRAIFEAAGAAPDDQLLSERVMRLEQMMTTGGGWQDQAGGLFSGAKLLVSGPGLRQRVRVYPVQWTAARQAEFEQQVVLYYTGIRRVARDLLRQVVGRYLARETACVQVLHSIKTLAMEMAHAMQEGDWDYLGSLLDRHWELNQILDPNTTNAPINALLESAQPFLRGAKLAGAGGGGFLILLAKSPEAAKELSGVLDKNHAGSGGAAYPWKVATDGLRIIAK